MDIGKEFNAKKQALKPIRTVKEERNEINDAEEEELLSPMARMFHEPDFNLYIIAIMGCKTKVNVELIKTKLVHTLLKHPRFSSLQVVDEINGEKMKWIPTNVDLENHIIVPNLDQNMESPDKFVEDYISNLSKTTIDMSKPMWELHILNIKTSEAESVGILCVHHSLGDGISLMSLLLACTRKTSDPDALPTIPTQRLLKWKKVNGFWQYFIKFLLLLRVLGNTVLDILIFVATTIFLRDNDTPLRGPVNHKSTHRRFVHRIVSLDDIKLVKNAMNATINDVTVGVTQAGLSRYLNRKYGQDEKKESGREKTNNLPENIRLRATIMMNMRPSPGIHAMAEMMEKNTKAKWGNFFGFILLPFNIAMHKDPLDYIREAKATIDRKKQSFEALFSVLFANLIIKLFGSKVASALSARLHAQTTLAFSNIFGPLEEISFYGHPLAYIVPACYGQVEGLMIHVMSYINKLSFVLSVDEEIISDPHQLCDDLVESLKLIKDAVLIRDKIKDE